MLNFTHNSDLVINIFDNYGSIGNIITQSFLNFLRSLCSCKRNNIYITDKREIYITCFINKVANNTIADCHYLISSEELNIWLVCGSILNTLI